MSTTAEAESKPNINVTPLIDVLLVLLIIFMVAVPLKPRRFAAKLPAKPDSRVLPADPRTLVVTIEPDRSLKLNFHTDLGTVNDPSKLCVTRSTRRNTQPRNREL